MPDFGIRKDWMYPKGSVYDVGYQTDDAKALGFPFGLATAAVHALSGQAPNRVGTSVYVGEENEAQQFAADQRAAGGVPQQGLQLGERIRQIFQGLRGPAQPAGIPGVDGTIRPTGYGEDNAAGLRTSAVYGVRG